jgi:ABC-2 type transport system permease protein
MEKLGNIFQLGIKELRSLWHDKVLLIFIVWAFSGGIYTAATGISGELHKASIAILDEDRTPLSQRFATGFYPPQFLPPVMIDASQMDPGLDSGRFTFVLVVPANFQRDVLAGRQPALQLNIDATRMTQAFIGTSYIQNITMREVNRTVHRSDIDTQLPIRLVSRVRFNPNLTGAWFGSMVEVVNNISMLSIMLCGAALIREREHGTIEHLLVMPLTPLEIMLAKMAANSLVILLMAAFGLLVIVKGVLQVPITGSIALFLSAAALTLFATTAMGIFLATIARSMPQLGLLMILAILPLLILSGAVTPRESMPQAVQWIMQAAPTTHFVDIAQAVLFRGAGIEVIWPHLLAIIAIGAAFFAIALARFRKSIALV